MTFSIFWASCFLSLRVKKILSYSPVCRASRKKNLSIPLAYMHIYMNTFILRPVNSIKKSLGKQWLFSGGENSPGNAPACKCNVVAAVVLRVTDPQYWPGAACNMPINKTLRRPWSPSTPLRIRFPSSRRHSSIMVWVQRCCVRLFCVFGISFVCSICIIFLA
jgi:hypothetical protein